MLNKEELKEILAIENSTNLKPSQNPMIPYIIGRLEAAGIPYEEYKDTNCHNIFSIREGKPLISCHTDSMKGTYSDIKKKKGQVFPAIEILDADDGSIVAYRGDRQAVIGGDDGCGIFILLNLIETGHDISFAFFSGEEQGMIGSRCFSREERHKELLRSVPWALVIDRMGNSDIICTQNNYGSKEFEAALCRVGEAFGYRPARGFVSDADVLRNYISCANLSVGYYHAHSPEEFVVYEDVEKAYNYIHEIIGQLSETRFEVNEMFAGLYVQKTVKTSTLKLRKKLNEELIFLADEKAIDAIMVDTINNPEEEDEKEEE